MSIDINQKNGCREWNSCARRQARGNRIEHAPSDVSDVYVCLVPMRVACGRAKYGLTIHWAARPDADALHCASEYSRMRWSFRLFRRSEGRLDSQDHTSGPAPASIARCSIPAGTVSVCRTHSLPA